MAEASFTFPKGFLWGTATSSHQVEGNNTNNTWFAWETEGKIINGDKSGLACDWWSGRWREDFDRAAETGQNAHRFSIEWSRIQPAPNRWDEDAIDRYRQMARGLIERGIKPMVTLHHFTDPLWLRDMRGWENDFVIDYFDDYTKKVVESLHEYVNLWCTINEPNVFTVSSYLLGDFPPGSKSIRTAYKVIQNLIKAHTLAYYSIHKIQPDAQVGLAHHYRGFSPAMRKNPIDRWVANQISSIFNDTFPQTFKTGVCNFLNKSKFFPAAKGTEDYFGLNYYTREYITFSPFSPRHFFFKRSLNPGADQSPTGEIANEPDYFYQALKWSRNSGLPIYITENGIEDSEDQLRPKYIIQHIHKLWRAVNFNWPIRGYFHWTLVDNFEWERGWSQRFGLWELDVDTQKRRKRKSADLFEVICKENSLSTEMVIKFSNDLTDTIFPG